MVNIENSNAAHGTDGMQHGSLRTGIKPIHLCGRPSAGALRIALAASGVSEPSANLGESCRIGYWEHKH